MVAFDAAARHLSFTAAAAELRVTQAAISRQIKSLEEFLGFSLFERRNRSVVLTREGIQYHLAVGSSLKNLAETALNLAKSSAGSPLVIGCTAAFSTYWLMPRIALFRQQHPDIELRFAIEDRLVDLRLTGIDLSVRYGGGDWPYLRQKHLFGSEIEPLCSPNYWRNRPKISNPSELLKESLLDLEIPVDMTWQTWLRTHAAEFPAGIKRLVMDQYPALVQAALSGQGIALLGSPLVDDLKASGALINPTNFVSEPFPGGYYLVSPSGVPVSSRQRQFEDWLLGEVRVSGSASP